MLAISISLNAQGQQQINATLTQGDFVGWSFLLKIDDTPINLTGAYVKMIIGMPTPLVLSTENSGITMINPVGGEFLVNISSDQTEQFDLGTYQYEVWVKQNIASSNETQYISGVVTINPSISVLS